MFVIIMHSLYIILYHSLMVYKIMVANAMFFSLNNIVAAEAPAVCFMTDI